MKRQIRRAGESALRYAMLRAAWIAVTIVGATASPASAQEAAGTVADVRAAAAVDSLLAIHRTILRAHTDRS